MERLLGRFLSTLVSISEIENRGSPRVDSSSLVL